MTLCPPTPLQRFPPFHSEVEVAHLVLVAHRDQPDPKVTQVLLALPDPRAMLVNADQKALGVFRVLLDLLAVELEEPRFPAQRGLGVLPVLRDLLVLKVIMVFQAPPEQMVNQDPRVRTVRSVPLDLLGHRALQDLLESVVPPVRMRLPLSWIST